MNTGSLPRSVDVCESAETSRLGETLARLAPALEHFNRFEGVDPASRRRAEWMTLLDTPLPRDGAGLDTVMRELAEVVIPNGVRNGAPGFSGWVTTAPTTSGVAGALASTVAGSQRAWIHAFNQLEGTALRWLAELLGIPPGLQGLFVGGGSVANLVGLGAARQHAFERLGIDPAKNGLPPGGKWRIYASSEVHHVVMRAAGVLGLGRASVYPVATDAALRLDVAALRRCLDEDRAADILPLAIVASGGTVNTGAVDPIAELADLAAERTVWLHVDGAYGMFGIVDESVAPLFRGVERADSVAVDPHKWLAAPVGCGAVFVRDRALLGRAFTLEPAEYLEGNVTPGPLESPFDDFGAPYHHYGVDQSAPSRGVQVWAILREIGANGVRARVARHNAYARLLADLVRADDRLELLAEPVLSICCFRYRRAGLTEETLKELNIAIARRLRSESRCVPSTTIVHGRFAIRPCFINPRTTRADVEELARLVCECGDAMTR